MLAPRDLWSSILDLIFPPRCVSCQQVGAWLCDPCLDQAQRVEPPFCARCGDGIHHSGLCARCRTDPPETECIRSVTYFGGVLQQAIHQFKYKGLKQLAKPLGGLMAEYLKEHPIPVDVVVPVPLHVARFRERGYNQAALLAREMAGGAGLVVDERTLVRRRATAPQVDLDAEERKVNVRGAFRCVSDALTGRDVLLVDDVCTTGSTLDACAVALREGGARSVRALTLARAR